MTRESVVTKIASMRKILFHDVDGCLNTPDGASLPFEAAQLQPIQRNALSQLGEVLDKSDIDVMVLNTGRSIAASIFLAEAINSQKLKYIVAEHGAAGKWVRSRINLPAPAIQVRHPKRSPSPGRKT